MSAGAVRWGVAFTVAAALAYACQGILLKVALAAGLGFTFLLATRYVGASALLWTAAHRGYGARPDVPPQDSRVVFLTGLVAHAAAVAGFTAAVLEVGVAIATVLLYAFPAMVAVGMAVTGREPLHALRIGAVALSMLGVALIATGGEASGNPLGIGLALLSALGNAVIAITGDRYAAAMGPVAFTARLCTGAAITFVAAMLVLGAWHTEWPVSAWLLVPALILLPTMVGMTGFMAGVERLGPAMASVVLASEPVFAMILAAVVLSEGVGAQDVIGAALIVSATVMMRIGDLRRPPAALSSEAL